MSTKITDKPNMYWLINISRNNNQTHNAIALNVRMIRKHVPKIEVNKTWNSSKKVLKINTKS